MKAVCRWCQGEFVNIDGFYWCATQRCARRQAALSIAFLDNGRSIPYYVPLPAQVDFERSPTQYLLGGGAAGASKSHQARFGLYRRAMLIPHFEALILRRNWTDLEKHHLRMMEREARELSSRFRVKAEYFAGAREMRITHPDGRVSIIEGGHMDDANALEKYLSRERDAIVADEGSTFPPAELMELSTRARSTKPEVERFAATLWGLSPSFVRQHRSGGAVFWVLTNPGGQAAHTLRQFFIEKQPDLDQYPQMEGTDSDGRPMYDPAEWGFVPARLEDNPYLSPDYERKLALSRSKERYQQLRYGNWDVVAGQFFSEFDPQIHVRDLGTPSGVKWFRSYDYGYMHKGVCLWWACLPDGRYYIRAELVHRQWPITKIAKEMHVLTKKLKIPTMTYTVADKFSMGTARDETSGQSRGRAFAMCGIRIVKTDQSREQGWTRCRELLAIQEDGHPGVIIHPSCAYLIRTMQAATSDEHNPEDIAFADDHALDSFRMGAQSRHVVAPSHTQTLPPNAIGHLLRQAQIGQRTDPYAFH